MKQLPLTLVGEGLALLLPLRRRRLLKDPPIIPP